MYNDVPVVLSTRRVADDQRSVPTSCTTTSSEEEQETRAAKGLYCQIRLRTFECKTISALASRHLDTISFALLVVIQSFPSDEGSWGRCLNAVLLARTGDVSRWEERLPTKTTSRVLRNSTLVLNNQLTKQRTRPIY